MKCMQKILSSLFLGAMLLGCYPAQTPIGDSGNQPPVPPNNKIDPATVELFARIGRLEELTRVVSTDAPTWGSTDSKIAALKTKLLKLPCAIDHSQDLFSPTQPQGSATIVGVDCPIKADLHFKSGSTADLTEFVAQATVDESMSAEIGLKEVRGKWRALYQEASRQWSGKGETQITLVQADGSNETLKINFRFELRSIKKGSTFIPIGNYKIELATAAKKMVLARLIKIENTGIGRTYTINNEAVTDVVFETYLSRLGWLSGLGAWIDAG
jgi:hypothetical protein